MSRHNERCKNCCFFLSQEFEGECHRHAPTYVPAHPGISPARAAFPPMAPQEWCGEWQAIYEFTGGEHRVVPI